VICLYIYIYIYLAVLGAAAAHGSARIAAHCVFFGPSFCELYISIYLSVYIYIYTSMSMCRNLFVYGCISMQRYWSSLRYSILRTLFLLAADLRRHPPSPLYCLIYIRISCSFGRGCCSREHPDRCPLRLFRSFPL